MWASLEGLIGCGKTTFIEKVIKPHIRNLCIIPEPVEAWEASGVLKRSYTDPTFAFAAQCTYLTTRIDQFEELYNPEKLNFSERSPFSDKLFWNIQSVDPLLHITYLNMWKHWQKLMPVKKPNLFIYLVTSVDVCMSRLHERGRDAESGVKKEYQELLKQEHDAYLLDPLGVLMPDGSRVPCIVVDTSENYRDDPKVAEKLAALIKRVI